MTGDDGGLPLRTTHHALRTDVSDVRLLIFRVRDRTYGVEAKAVDEVQTARHASRIPGTTAAVRGLAAWRGTVVTVVDVAWSLGLVSGPRVSPRLPLAPASGAPGCLLLVDYRGHAAALAVDEVLDLVAEPTSEPTFARLPLNSVLSDVWPDGREAPREEGLPRLIGELLVQGERLAARASAVGDPALDEIVREVHRLVAGLQGEAVRSGMIRVAHALLVRVGEERYAVPLSRVVEAHELHERGRPPAVPLVPLRERLAVPGEPRTVAPAVVVVDAGLKRAGLVVDEVLGREEVVVREFDAPRGALPLFGGVTVLRHGEPALILEPARLV